MSYDISFKAKLENSDKYVPILIKHNNYTYNMSKRGKWHRGKRVLAFTI